MIRCVKCGCSRLDSRGMGCVLCGGSPSVRSEQVHVTDETKIKLLAHADGLKTYGVLVEEQRTFRKVAGALEAFGIGLQIRSTPAFSASSSSSCETSPFRRRTSFGSDWMSLEQFLKC